MGVAWEHVNGTRTCVMVEASAVCPETLAEVNAFFFRFVRYRVKIMVVVVGTSRIIFAEVMYIKCI